MKLKGLIQKFKEAQCWICRPGEVQLLLTCQIRSAVCFYKILLKIAFIIALIYLFAWRCMCAIVYTWKSEDVLKYLRLSFCCVGPGNRTRACWQAPLSSEQPCQCYKQSFIRTKLYSFVHVLSMVAFMQKWQNSVVLITWNHKCYKI